MRKAIAIVGLVFALGLLAPTVSLGKDGGTKRPYKDTASGYQQAVLTATGVDINGWGTGQATHLGSYSYTYHLLGTPTGPDTLSIAGTGEMRAANGDKLFTEIGGDWHFSPECLTLSPGCKVTGNVNMRFTGGTGRFRGAEGVRNELPGGQLSRIPGTNLFTSQVRHAGWISY